MKAILISIKPEWVEKILNGEKTIEIRKTIPKCELPIKVYIYCTNDQKHLVAPFEFLEGWFYREYNNNTSYACGCTSRMGETINGKVVAEFTLNKIDFLIDVGSGIHYADKDFNDLDLDYLRANSCLSDEQIYLYLGLKKDSGYYNEGFAWHIEDLHIYDTPKELSEFKTLPCEKSENACANCKYLQVTNTPYAYETYCPIENGKTLTRPPQSWCYVEVTNKWKKIIWL